MCEPCNAAEEHARQVGEAGSAVAPHLDVVVDRVADHDPAGQEPVHLPHGVLVGRPFDDVFRPDA